MRYCTAQVDGCEAIISGELDNLPEQAFMSVGTIDDVVAKAKELEA